MCKRPVKIDFGSNIIALRKKKNTAFLRIAFGLKKKERAVFGHKGDVALAPAGVWKCYKCKGHTLQTHCFGRTESLNMFTVTRGVSVKLLYITTNH